MAHVPGGFQNIVGTFIQHLTSTGCRIRGRRHIECPCKYTFKSNFFESFDFGNIHGKYCLPGVMKYPITHFHPNERKPHFPSISQHKLSIIQDLKIIGPDPRSKH